MATQADVRTIAMAMPGATEEKGRFAFNVANKGKEKGFVWVWLQRIHPKKARVPNPAVIGVRTSDVDEKAALLDADPDNLFTEPHYNGYPAVLVRLENISDAALRQLIVQSWRYQAPKALVAAYDAEPAAKPVARRKPAARKRRR